MAPRIGLLTLLLVWSSSAGAQPPVQVARTFTVADGLPSPIVTAIAQDDIGFLWAGTVDGLAFFDGDAFSDVLPPSQLSTRYVNAGALLPLDNGDLWIGTEGGALLRDGRTGRLRVVRDALPNPDVLALASDGDRIWIGTVGGLASLDTPTGTPRPFRSSLPNPSVRTLSVAADGSLWVGTLDGLCRIARRAQTCRPIDVPPDHRRIQTLEADGNAVWIGSSSGALLRATLSGRTTTLTTLPSPLDSHAPYGTTPICSATYGAGLLHVLPDGTPSPTFGASVEGGSDQLIDVAFDRTGSLWVATDRGLTLLTPRIPFDFVPGLPTQGITALARVGSSLVVATAQGLARLDAPTGPARPWSSASGVTALAEADGRLLAATQEAGAFSLDADGTPTPLGFAPPPGTDLLRLNAIAHADGAVWVASATSGVCRLASGRTTCWNRASSLQADRATALCVAPDGTVYAGRLGDGAQRFRRDGGRVLASAVPEVPREARVVSIGCSSGLSFGLVDGFVHRGDSISTALPHPTVACSVRDEQGRTWVGTYRGLAVLERDGTLRAVPELPALEVRPGACTRVGPYLFIGSRQGLLRFRPADVPPPSFGPVAITRIEGADTGGLLPASAERATAAAGRTPVEISFAMLHAGAPGRRLQYRLRGHNADWIEAGPSRTARFYGLPPGAYRFEVRAAANPQISAALPLRIQAPLWQRPWFLFLVVTSLGLGVGAAAQARARARERLETTRRQIADDLHDDVGSRLGGLATALDVTALTVPPDASGPVRERAQEARQILADLRDTVWIVDGADDSFQALVERVQLSAERLLPSASVSVTASGDLDRPLDIQRRRHLLFFCTEALHNAARHAQPEQVTVSFHVDPADGVQVSIADDGRGFETASGGRGMDTLRRRADALAGTVDVHSAPASGTRVTLVFPL